MKMIYWKAKSFFIIYILFFQLAWGKVSPPVVVKSTFTQQKLESNVSFLLDSSAKLSLFQIKNSTHFLANTKKYINFKTFDGTCWLRVDLIVQTPDLSELILITSGLDSTLLSVFIGDSLIHQQAQGTHLPLNSRAFFSPLHVFPFKVIVGQKYTLFLKARMSNYPLSVYPLMLSNRQVAYQYLQHQELFRSIYIGGLVVILLFAGYMALFFQGKLYLYYLLCATCSLVMVLIYHNYAYLFFEELPLFLRNKNGYGIIASLLPVFYLLFAKEYVKYGFVATRKLLIITHIGIGINIVVVFVALVTHLSFFQYRVVFHLVISTNTLLMLTYVFLAIQKGYRPAWFFIFATLPVLSVGIWESLSFLHDTPIQKMHSLYYGFTLYEMYVLMLGLTMRFRVYQEERKTLQRQMFEVQIQVEDKVRHRIGLDLHDKVGGLLAVLKLNLEFLIKRKIEREQQEYVKIFSILDIAAEETRRISHDMMSSRLQERGLINMIRELYQDMEHPTFIIHTNDMEQRLSNSTEMMLHGILNECITNILKHAQAQRVEIQINRNKNNELIIIIEDDGLGFDFAAQRHNGKGLMNLQTRVKEHLKGQIKIDSTIGKGTVVVIKIKENIV